MKTIYRFTTEVTFDASDLYHSELRKIFSQTGVSWQIEESWDGQCKFRVLILATKQDAEYIKGQIERTLGLEIKELTDE